MAHKQHKKRLSRDARHEKRMKRMMSWVLVFLMVISMAGIFVSNQSGNKDLRYNDYKFEVVQQPNSNQYVYVLKKDNSGKYFYSLPQDDLTIPSEGNLSKVFYPAKYFVLTDMGDNPQVASFYDQIRYELNIYSGKNSLLGSPERNGTLPHITCINSTLEIPVIEFNTTNETRIIVDESTGCIKINSRLDDLALIRDRLLYTSTGIINE